MKIFITGIDTGVGKTFISAQIMNAWSNKNPAYYKPIQTGSPSPAEAEDVLAVQALTHHAFDAKVSCGVCLKAPLSPYQAAKAENLSLAPELILQDLSAQIQQHSTLIVEGTGGLMVPITPQYFMLDLIQDSHLSVVLVTHPRLGTLNHTLLSLHALKEQNIPILGFVMNQFPIEPSLAEQESISILESLGHIRCLGVVPINASNRHLATFLT
jgi:dethiobiotin synthase